MTAAPSSPSLKYQTGEFPPQDEAENVVRSLMRDIGVANLSMKAVRHHLEEKYQLNLRPQNARIGDMAKKLMGETEFQKQLSLLHKPKKTAVTSFAKEKKAEALTAKEEVVKYAKKPEDYPKAALSAYIMFSTEKSKQMRMEDSTMSIQDAAKKVAAIWQSMSDDEKALFNKKAVDDKERFVREMTDYLAKGGEKFVRVSKKNQKSSKRKRVKDPNTPKAAITAYFFFMKDHRADVTQKVGNNVTAVSKALGEMWSTIDTIKKSKYEVMALKDKERYLQECRERGLPLPKSAKGATATAIDSDHVAGKEEDEEEDDANEE